MGAVSWISARLRQRSCRKSSENLLEVASGSWLTGGIRSGADVFKALALGADGVLICRPFVPGVYGAGEEGVKAYIDKIGGELQDVMEMCGAKKSVSD